MNIKPPEPFDGRVLGSISGRWSVPASGEARSAHCNERITDGIWEQYLKFTELNGVRYLEEGNEPLDAAQFASSTAGCK